MLIHAYGLFWRRDEVPWNPGSGGSSEFGVNPFSLLGRHGAVRPKLRVIDVRPMHGVYLLHSHYGTYYVGLAKGTGGLGSRLRDHTRDKHADYWDSFSWFAFDRVLARRLRSGLTRSKHQPLTQQVRPTALISDVEAMLIMALGTTERGNRNQAAFASATRWQQVKLDEWGTYLRRAQSMAQGR